MPSFEINKTSSRDLALLNSFNKTNDWLINNIDTLMSKYEGNFVAIKNNKVVAVSNTLESLAHELKEKKLLHDVAVNIFKASLDTFRAIL